MHGQIVEYTNIAEASKVPPSTVKEYFTILEDTLVGSFLWPWDASERKKARPKFYFFDTGVVRALQNRLNDPPTGQEKGFLFEGWFVYEAKKINSYFRKRLNLSLWRDGDHEIDLLVHNNKHEGFAIEIKSGIVQDFSEVILKKLRTRFPQIEVIIASLQDKEPRRLSSGTLVLPWKTALEKIRDF
jgi:predicted AAA+ superfamily ATPase